MVVLVAGVARLSVSVRVTNTDTEATSAMAAMMAATPTIQGQRGGFVLLDQFGRRFVAVVVV